MAKVIDNLAVEMKVSMDFDLSKYQLVPIELPQSLSDKIIAHLFESGMLRCACGSQEGLTVAQLTSLAKGIWAAALVGFDPGEIPGLKIGAFTPLDDRERRMIECLPVLIKALQDIAGGCTGPSYLAIETLSEWNRLRKL